MADSEVEHRRWSVWPSPTDAVVASTVEKLPDSFWAIGSHLRGRYDQGAWDELEKRFGKIAKRYRATSGPARLARKFVSLLIGAVNLVAVAVTAALLTTRQVPSTLVIVFSVTLSIILLQQYVPNGRDLSVGVRLAGFSAVAVAGHLVPYSSESPVLRYVSSLLPFVPAVVEAAAVAATAGLCATVATVLLSRVRRDIYGLFHPFGSPREQIVCELVQVVYLLTSMSGDGADNRHRKRVVEEKIGRVSYLFRPRMRGRSDWPGCRRSATHLKRLKRRVRAVGFTSWHPDAEILAKVAERVFVDDEEIRTVFEGGRSRRSRHLKQSLAAALAVMLTIASVLGLKAMEIEIGPILPLFNSLMLMVFVVAVVDSLAPEFIDRFVARVRTIVEWAGADGSPDEQQDSGDRKDRSREDGEP